MLNESIYNPECRENNFCPRGNEIFFSLKEPMMIPSPGASNVYPMPAWYRFLSHTLFLLPIRIIPKRSQNLTEVPEVLFHGHLYLLGDINNNDTILHCLHCFYVLQGLNIYMLCLLCSIRTTPSFYVGQGNEWAN